VRESQSKILTLDHRERDLIAFLDIQGRWTLYGQKIAGALQGYSRPVICALIVVYLSLPSFTLMG
jgi:hypothetical protein